MTEGQDRHHDGTPVHPIEPKGRQNLTDTGRHRPWIGTLELLTVAMIATFLGAIGARVAPVAKVGVDLILAAQPPVITKYSGLKAVGVVFFSNGTAHMDASSRNQVELWARALRDCGNPHVIVVGSTSSAPFWARSNRNNVGLAKARAQAVLTIFKNRGVLSVEVQDVKQEGDLVATRLINDHPNGSRNLSIEAVARRTDILFEDMGECRVAN
jgi:hypothetical protein